FGAARAARGVRQLTNRAALSTAAREVRFDLTENSHPSTLQQVVGGGAGVICRLSCHLMSNGHVRQPCRAFVRFVQTLSHGWRTPPSPPSRAYHLPGGRADRARYRCDGFPLTPAGDLHPTRVDAVAGRVRATGASG